MPVVWGPYVNQWLRAWKLWALLFFRGLCGREQAGYFLAGLVEIRWLIW